MAASLNVASSALNASMHLIQLHKVSVTTAVTEQNVFN